MMTDFNAIAHDLDACDAALAFAKGRGRTKFINHRKACMAAIREANVADGLCDISDEELLAELMA